MGASTQGEVLSQAELMATGLRKNLAKLASRGMDEAFVVAPANEPKAAGFMGWTRVFHKNPRVGDKKARARRELARVGDENSCVGRENPRVRSKMARVGSKNSRVDNEKARARGEMARVDIENLRVSGRKGPA